MSYQITVEGWEIKCDTLEEVRAVIDEADPPEDEDEDEAEDAEFEDHVVEVAEFYRERYETITQAMGLDSNANVEEIVKQINDLTWTPKEYEGQLLRMAYLLGIESPHEFHSNALAREIIQSIETRQGPIERIAAVLECPREPTHILKAVKAFQGERRETVDGLQELAGILEVGGVIQRSPNERIQPAALAGIIDAVRQLVEDKKKIFETACVQRRRAEKAEQKVDAFRDSVLNLRFSTHDEVLQKLRDIEAGTPEQREQVQAVVGGSPQPNGQG